MLSSFISSKFLSSTPSSSASSGQPMPIPRDRPLAAQSPSDPLSHLRFVLETMPGSRKYVFTPATRAEILSELYEAFWGQHVGLFLPGSTPAFLPNHTLHQTQVALGFASAGQSDLPYPGKVCSRTIVKGESCFRCRDCGLDESCVMCSRCFYATNHTNHNVSFYVAQQSGGCCDCGDEEAWKVPMNCPHHPPPIHKDDLDDLSQVTPKSGAKMITPEVPPVPDYPHRISVPPELRDSMQRTIGYALDFLLDTLDYSPEEPAIPKNEADLRLQPSADPMLKDQYCVVLWNDEKHSFEEVIKMLCDLTNRSREEAKELTQKIDEMGRSVVEMNSNVTRLLEIAQAMANIDLGITVRRAYDTFREQMVEVIIEWLLDLSRCQLGPDTLVIRELIMTELLSPRKRESTPHNQFVITLKELSETTRLDYLFIYHTRLWKKPRLSIKELYGSILALSPAHKLALASRFAGVYHRIVNSYLLIDREAETSIKYLALELFTVPSVAAHTVKTYKLVHRLLSIITSFFTNQVQDKHIIYPPAPPGVIDAESQPFKSKRFMPVFSDLRYLVITEPVQELIAHNSDYINSFALVCQLFMCIHPNKRAVSTHVEYEGDLWISVFNVTLSLSRVVKVYGEAFAKSTVRELLAAILIVMSQISTICCDFEEERLDKTKFGRVQYHEVIFGDAQYTIVNFNVLEGWVSFHHSLHWLLAELFKHVDLLDEQAIVNAGLVTLREVIYRRKDEKALLGILDFPLRVLAMSAQIRTGLWVRNGFTIRGQLLHYRDYLLRELCCDQDIYLVQTGLILADPNVVIVSILDRYSLLDFFAGATLHDVYEGPQLSSMVEEALYLIITILSENANASKMPIEQVVRREIIHSLILGPCTFTELSKRVAERVAAYVGFDRILSTVANFRPPETPTDTGMYELKDETYDEVNPFFYHYTRNKREEVENILLNRLRKKGVRDAVMVPKPFGVTKGPYSIVPSTFESEALLQVMFYAIFNVLVMTDESGNTPPSGEAIMGQALHLVMVAIVERAPIFSQLAAIKTFAEDKCLLDILCYLEHHDKFSTYKPTTAWILDNISKYVPEELSSRRQVLDNQLTSLDAEEAKKRCVKARQEAIMQKMKAQQEHFAVMFDDIDDEDEEMEEEAQEQVSYGTCIVCRGDLAMGEAFGVLGLLQPSRVLRKQPEGQSGYLAEALNLVPSLDRHVPSPQANAFPPPEEETKSMTLAPFEGFPSAHSKFGLHASICTHMMHVECFQVYNASIRQRHRTQTTRNHPENILRKEFICPLCRSLGNVMLPLSQPSKNPLNSIPFPDWIRAAGISILKSKPDPQFESLQSRNGTGEFVFWSAQDIGYTNLMRLSEQTGETTDMMKIVDTVISVVKMYSQQTRHLRDRPEPDTSERGAGMYFPEEVLGYTIGVIETTLRGTAAPNDGLVVDSLTDGQMGMIRSLLAMLARLAAMHFKKRPDEGREAIKQAIIKRLLPEWSRTSFTSFSYPLLLRDPLTILVETATVAPEILRHVMVLAYYACLARTVIGMVYILNKARNYTTLPSMQRAYDDLFGDVRMFFMSVVRHSPVFEHMATVAFDTFGEARIEKLLYVYTLPFLRRAAILCRSALPSAFPTPAYPATGPTEQTEYRRLLDMLGIPPLSDLPNQDTLQNALSGWCAHYGHSQVVSQLNCGVSLEYPAIYRLPRLPLALDNLFAVPNSKALMCQQCWTVPGDAAICLICGTMCCMQSNCCQDVDNDKGECNMHTRECGGMVGVFFLVKRCSLLYIYAGNGSFLAPPYLDMHGEIDISMRCVALMAVNIVKCVLMITLFQTWSSTILASCALGRRSQDVA
ncbi:hypothetical protein AX15_004547 [Amanita polypyramis BW_CC]|nr:hypothetical protein AX15_004547 [Amanita polypyramis BW_CC]